MAQFNQYESYYDRLFGSNPKPKIEVDSLVRFNGVGDLEYDTNVKAKDPVKNFCYRVLEADYFGNWTRLKEIPVDDCGVSLFFNTKAFDLVEEPEESEAEVVKPLEIGYGFISDFACTSDECFPTLK